MIVMTCGHVCDSDYHTLTQGTIHHYHTLTQGTGHHHIQGYKVIHHLERRENERGGEKVV